MVLAMVLMFGEASYADLSDGLVAHYPLDGNAIDATGSGNNGVVNGATLTADRFGNTDSAYSLDGTDDYIDFLDNPLSTIGADDFTISFWFITNVSNNQQMVFLGNDIQGALNGEEYAGISYIWDNKLNEYLEDDIGGQSTFHNLIGDVVSLNEWHHAVGIYSNNGLKLYVDGNLEGTETNVNYNFNSSDWNNMRFGANVYDDSARSFFNGMLDDVRLYNRALSDCEIQELFTGQPSCTPIYTCSGFESPMDSGPVTVKKNRVLPLKAQLFNANGDLVTDADIVEPPVIQVIFDSGSGGDPVDVTDEALPAGQGTEGNQFVFTDGDKWQYNLKTKNYTASGTYTIFMDTGDGSEYAIDPQCEAQFIIK
jgi:concanavalin A-like lectin/glucanase superfamily protein